MSKQWLRIERIKASNKKKDAVLSMQKLSDNEVASLIKGKTSDNFLYSNEWLSLKRKVHEKYGYRCMCCGFTPKNKRKSNVDHIKPRKFFPDLALDFDNLQVLCGAHRSFAEQRAVKEAVLEEKAKKKGEEGGLCFQGRGS